MEKRTPVLLQQRPESHPWLGNFLGALLVVCEHNTHCSSKKCFSLKCQFFSSKISKHFAKRWGGRTVSGGKVGWRSLLLSVAYRVCWGRAAQSRGCGFLWPRSPHGRLQALLRSGLAMVKANESGREGGFCSSAFLCKKDFL